MMILNLICVTVYLLIFKLFLAGKDSTSYRLKDKKASGILTTVRIQRWHRDGVAIDLLNTVPVAYIFGDLWWQVCIISALIRLSVFDIAFNYWAGLNPTYLGSTAWTDKFFIKIFGINGAVEKTIFFFAILILFFVSKLIWHY